MVGGNSLEELSRPYSIMAQNSSELSTSLRHSPERIRRVLRMLSANPRGPQGTSDNRNVRFAIEMDSSSARSVDEPL